MSNNGKKTKMPMYMILVIMVSGLCVMAWALSQMPQGQLKLAGILATGAAFFGMGFGWILVFINRTT